MSVEADELLSSAPEVSPPSGRGVVAGGALIAAVVIWGASFVIVQDGVQDMPLFEYLFLWFAASAAVLLPLAWRFSDLRPAVTNRALWLMGCLLFAGLGLQTAGLETTSPGRSAFLTSLSVVFVPLIVRAISRVPLPASRWAASAGAAIGIFLIYGDSSARFHIGDLLSLLCAVAFACHIFVGQRVARSFDVLSAVAVQGTLCTFAAAVGLLFESHSFVAPTSNGLVSVAYAGVFATVVAYGLQLVGQRRLPAVETAVILTLEPVVAVVVSLAAGRDSFSQGLLFGGALVFVSAVFVQVDGTVRTRFATRRAGGSVP